MNIEQFKNTLYLASSWRLEQKETSSYFARTLANEFLSTVVGDHQDAPKDGTRLSYAARVDSILAGCTSFCILFPRRETPQTTSYHMFVELLLAAKRGLPILIFAEDSVQLQLCKAGDEISILFGQPVVANSKVATIKEISKPNFHPSNFSDAHKVVLPKGTLVSTPMKFATNPVEFQNQQAAIREAVGEFMNTLPERSEIPYAFLIAPYSMSNERILISKAIYEETGLPCLNGSDAWAGAPYSTESLKEKIADAQFVIAELTGSRGACIFEAGVAAGANRDISVVIKDRKKPLPHGLRKFPVESYHNIDQLHSAVKHHCKPYRRRVFNIEVIEDNQTTLLENSQPTTNSSREYSWLEISALSGVVFMSFALVLILIHQLIPSPWNLVMCATMSLGALASFVTLMHNPKFYYRRLLSAVFVAGVFTNASGYSVSAIVKSEYANMDFKWSDESSWYFNITWLLLIAILVWADSRSIKSSNHASDKAHS